MKKLVSFLIALTVLVGIGIATYFMISQSKNNETYSISVSTTSGGSVNVKLDNNTYTIAEAKTSSYQAKNKSNLVLTASAGEGYTFKDWTINNNTYSTETTISISVTENKVIKANFNVKTEQLTITDNNGFSEQVEYSTNTNLLAFLNNKFTAPKGYAYSYQYNGEAITEETILNETKTIILIKNTLTYAVDFKLPEGYTFADSSTTKAVEYTIENITSLQVPELPSAKQHYTLAWEKNTFTTDDVDEIQIINAIETPIEYSATLTLPAGYTFEDGLTSKDATYNFRDKVINFPKVNTKEHYTFSWNEFNLTYSNEKVEITGSEVPVNYEVKFMDGTTQVGETKYYNIENKSIAAPDLASITLENKEYYNLSWAEYNLESLTNLEVQLNKTAKEYMFVFTLPDGYVFEENNANTYGVKYTIENIDSATFPALPQAKEHFTLTWEKDSLTKADLITTESITPIRAIETANTYIAKLILPAGCTFADGTSSKDVNYTYGETTISIPEVNIPAHYEISWPSYTLNNSATPTEITAAKSAIVYTAIFKHEGTEISKQTFTIENNKVIVPAVPTSTDINYIYAWENYTHELKNYTVNTVKITFESTHTLSYDFSTGYSSEDLTYHYKKVALHNGVVYVLDNTNNSIKTLTLDQLANNLFNNNPDLELSINGETMSNVNAAKTKLTTILSGGSSAITLTYTEVDEI